MRFHLASIYTATLLSTSVAALVVDRSATIPGNLFRRQDQASCLNPDVIAAGSSLTGQEPGTEGIKPGQSPSASDPNNFINFCLGKTLTNGRQNAAGSCNGIPMGSIPALENMISAMIISPAHNAQIPANTAIDFIVQTRGLSAGFFTNPTTTYYSAPQDLDAQGNIVGHCHMTVQDIGSFTSDQAPNPVNFAFFKGIDDNGNGQGLLRATDADGLPPGIYRVCTMISAQNHQPALMPVAQRGAQDDCVRFQVVGADPNPDGGDNNDGSAEEGGEDGGDADMGEIISATGDAVPAPTEPASSDASSVPAAESTAAPSSASAPTGGAAPSAPTAVAPPIPSVTSGNLGGAPPEVVFSGDRNRPFSVLGRLFNRFEAFAAVQRACQVQFDRCAEQASRGELGRGRSRADCLRQRIRCGIA